MSRRTRAARLLRFVDPIQRLRLALAVLLMVLVGATTARIPIVLGDVVDRMLAGTVVGLADAAPWIAALASIYLVREALQVARKLLVEQTCTSFEKTLRVELVARLLRHPLGALGAERVGALHGRLHRSVEGGVKAVKLLGLELLPVSLTALFALGAAFSRFFWLGVLMAAVVPVGACIVARQVGSQRGVRLGLMRVKEAMDGTVVEQLGGIEYVRAVDTVGVEVDKVAALSETLRVQEMRHHTAMAFYDAAKALNEGGFHALVVAASIVLAAAGTISVGDVLVCSVLFHAVTTPLRELARIVDEAHECSLRVDDLLTLLDRPLDPSFLTDGGGAPEIAGATPVLEASGLEVRYGQDGASFLALDGVDFVARRGEVIGLAGASGSGKTTLLRAVLRLVPTTGGVLRFGGTGIVDVSRAAIGRLVGFVSQVPFLFAGTVAENIAYGTPGATRDEIRRAAQLARIHDEVLAMPGAYDARVAERGLNLSGGQRQRIALARIFLKDPPLLVLDEATAALDNIAERAVLDALSAAMSGRTVLMVAHRLSALRRADRIYVFSKGRIVETGTFAELEARQGLFWRMLRSSRDVDGGDELASGSGLQSGVADCTTSTREATLGTCVTDRQLSTDPAACRL